MGVSTDAQSEILSDQIYQSARANQLDEAESIGLLALELLQGPENREYLGRAHQDLGNVYKVRQDYDHAFQQYREAYSIISPFGRPVEIRALIRSLVEICELQGSHELAIPYLQRSLQMALAEQNQGLIADQHQQLGEMYLKSRQFASAHESLQKGLAVFESQKDTIRMADLTSLIGEVFLAEKRYGQARQQFEQALVIQEANRNQAERARELFNLGRVALALGQPTEARDRFFDASLMIREDLPDLAARAETWHIIGDTYMEEDKYNRALVHYSEALKNQTVI
ncbi:MAG: tetratricopeptide repeat protein, partial [Bacteroidota bacterium]